jgi:hypothetical protein
MTLFQRLESSSPRRNSPFAVPQYTARPETATAPILSRFARDGRPIRTANRRTPLSDFMSDSEQENSPIKSAKRRVRIAVRYRTRYF